jgi:hypothetical protein
MRSSCRALPDSPNQGPTCDNARESPDLHDRGCWLISVEEDTMGKTGRKRRARKKKGANHGKRPNA